METDFAGILGANNSAYFGKKLDYQGSGEFS